MKKPYRIILLLAMLFAFTATGCGDQVEPEAIGLKYSSGSVEGKSFTKVLEPGSVDTFIINDAIYQLPISQRSFIIREDRDKEDSQSPDVDGVISVPSKDGTLVDFEVSTAFKLNTRTDDIPNFEGGTARKFYEDLCRHYGCDLDDGSSPSGWRQLLLEKFYPQLESAFKDEARKNDGDAIVNNTDGTLTTLQSNVGKTFLSYLERQTGAQFFCGPAFNRNDETTGCPPVELLIISADYNNPEVRKSREAKKVADDQSAAQSKLERALDDPQYLRYLEIQAAEKCTQNARANCIFSLNGQASVTVPTR